MSIQLYILAGDRVSDVNAWLDDKGELPPVASCMTGDLAALTWEDCCLYYLDNKMPYDGDNDPVYIPEIDRTFYCDY